MIELPWPTLDHPSYLAVYPETVWGAPTPARADHLPAEEVGPLVPDTDRALSVAEMAAAFDKLGGQTTQQEAELSIDPDDYPLF
jgi:hypothetical protein